MKKILQSLITSVLTLTMISGCGSTPSDSSAPATTADMTHTSPTETAAANVAPTSTLASTSTDAPMKGTPMPSMKDMAAPTPVPTNKATSKPSPSAVHESMNISPSPKPSPASTPSATPAPTAKPTAEPQAASKPETTKVTIKAFKFTPAEITVKKGTTVVFQNDDTVTHTATEDNGFDTGDIKAGDSKSVTFDKPGTYAYTCTPHEFMTAKIVVTE